MRRFASIIPPLVIIAVLLILFATRWETVATDTSSFGTIRYERDRWTGYVFVSQFVSGRTYYRYPEDAYIGYHKDPEKSWDQAIYQRINRLRKLSTFLWGFIFTIAVAWLTIAYRRAFLIKEDTAEKQ